MVLSTGKKAMMASLFIVAVACVLIGIASVSDESSAYAGQTIASDGNVFQYKVLSESGDTGTVSIKAHTGYDAATTELVIQSPVILNGITYTVVEIEQAGFSSKTNLQTVTLPDTVTTLKSSAFSGCTSLTSINLTHVTTIQYQALSGCSSLATITLSEGTDFIGYSAFWGTAITSLTLPASVTTLGQTIVGSCSNLTSVQYNCVNATKSSYDPLLTNTYKSDLVVHIGSGVQSIPKYAFYNMGGNIYLDDGSVLETIEMNAFASNGTNTNKSTIHFDLPATVTSIGNNAFTYSILSTPSITIPAGVTSFGSGVFNNTTVTTITVCTDAVNIAVTATNVIIGDNVASVTHNGYLTSSTTSLTIGANLSSIYDDFFAGGSAISTITVSAQNTNYVFEDGFLYELSNSVPVSVVKSVGDVDADLPDSVTLIAPYAFFMPSYGTRHVAHLGLNNVQTIGYRAFYYTKFECRLAIPVTVTSIGNEAFLKATLQSVVISSDCLSTGMFKNSSMDGITMSGISTIPADAFNGATIMSDLTLPSGVTTIGNNAFLSAKIVGLVTLTAGLTEIGENAFKDSKFDSITVPTTITSFGDGAFKNTAISAIAFNDSANVTIGASAFESTALKSLVITNNVTSIGDYAFHDCVMLSVITLNESESGGSEHVPNPIGTDAFDTGYCTVADTPCLHVIKWDGSDTDALDSYVGTTIVNTAPYVLPNAASEGEVEIQWTYTANNKTLTLNAGTSTSIASWDTWALYKTSAEVIIIGDDITTTAIMDGFTACRTLTIGTAVTSFGGATNLPYLEVLNFNAVNHTGIFSQSHEKLLNIGTMSSGVTLRFNGAITQIPANLLYTKTIAAVNLKTLEFNITKGTTTELKTGCLRCADNVTLLSINTAGTFTNPSYGPIYTGRNYGATLYIGDVTTQPTSTFYGVYITGVSYGPQTTSIAASAFAGNTVLKSITLSASCTSIGNQAFNGCKALQTVSMPGVVTLGDNVFLNCPNLLTVSLPSATSIGHQTFRGCTSLERVDIPLVESAGNATFMGCSNLTYADISSLSTLVSGTFSGCTKLQTVILSDEGCTIGDNAFNGCSSLSTIDLSHVTSIGIQAFYNCSSLNNQSTDLGSVQTIWTEAFSGTDSAHAPKLGTIDIHSATRLYSGAFKYAGVTGSIVAAENCQFGTENLATGEIFYGCSITNITINNEIQIPSTALSGIVGAYGITIVKISGLTTFTDNTNISSVTIPEGYRWVNGGNNGTDIYSSMFDGCTALTTVTIQGDRTGNDRLVIGGYAFRGCTALTTINGFEKIKSIGESAFSGCTSLFEDDAYDEVTFENITIGAAAFRNSGVHGTVTLTQCNVGEGNYTVGPFNGCSITALVFSGSSGVQTKLLMANISGDGYALTVNGTKLPDCRDDTKLLSVTIGSTVTGGGNILGFTGCTNLASVTFYASNYSNSYYATAVSGPFNGLEQTISLTIGNGVTNIPAYMFKGLTLSGDQTFGEVTIGSSAFANCTCGALSFGAGCVIGDDAFSECTSPSLTFGNGVSFGDSAFYACTATSVSLDTVASWGDGVFSDMANLGTLTFTGTQTVGANAFAGAGQNFTSLTIPETMTAIGDYAFQSCAYLTTLSIPASVTSIGTGSFQGCTRITTLAITDIEDAEEEQRLTIGNYAFSGEGLTTVSIPSRVKSMGSNAFGSLSSLTTVTVNSDLSNGQNAFSGSGSNEGLSVSFGEDVTAIPIGLFASSRVSSIGSFGGVAAIGNRAFENCTSLTSVNLPSGTIGEYAFSGCTGLTSLTIPEGVTLIGMRAFSGCSYLATVIVNADASWGTYVFENCERLTTLILPIEYNMANTALGGLTGITAITFRAASDGRGYNYGSNPANRVWYKNSVNSITVEDSVVSIGDYMFIECTSTTALSLPDTIASYGDSAFFNCRLTIGTITIPEIVQLGSNCFYGATGITAFSVDENNASCTSDASGVLLNAQRTQIIQYPAGRTATTYTVPDTVTLIQTGAFAGATNITSVTFPSGLSSVLNSAFYGCTGLTAIDLPDGMRNVGPMAFSGCVGLRTIYLPSSLTNLDSTAFNGITFLDHEDQEASAEIGYTYIYLSGNNPPVLGQRCTVKFITDENIADVASTIVTVGGTVQAPAQPNVLAVGYNFGGWFANEACSTPWDFENDTATSNTFIFAKSAPEAYTITLHNRTGPDSQSSEPYTVHYLDIGIDNVQIPNVEHKYMYGIYYRTVDPQDPEQFVYTRIANADLYFEYSDAAAQFLDEDSKWIFRNNVDLYAMWDDMLVTVLYDANNDSYDGDYYYDTVRWNDEYVIRDNMFDVPGYEFLGWNKHQYGRGDEVVVGSSFSIPNDAQYDDTYHYFAQWSIINYTITYHNTAGATHSNPASFTVMSQDIPLLDASKEYYDFLGWYDNEEFEGAPITVISRGSHANVDLYAKIVPTQYTITYYLYGGTNAQSNPDTYTYESAAISFANPTLSHYTFGGWFDNTQFTGDAVTGIAAHSHRNVTLFAKWTPTEYTITYNLNGGTNAQANPASFTYDTAEIVLADATWAHATFVGWYDNAEFDGEAVTSIPTHSDADVELFAKWNMTQYAITYNLNGGNNSQSNPATYTFTTETFQLADATKTGYTFGGWYPDAEFEGDKVTQIAVGSSGAKVLYAKFTVNEYTISFDSDGGSDVQAFTQDFGTDVNAPSAPTRNGYTFAGWQLNGQDYEFTTMPAANITLTATWEIVTYTITYVLNNGTNNQENPASYNIETETLTVKSASREGYTFLGWYGNENFSGIAITSIPQGSTGDMTLYAKFKADTFMVTLNMNGGTADGSALGVYDGKNLATMHPPMMMGYHVVGYYTDAEEGTLVADAIGHLQSNIDGVTDGEGAWIRIGALTLYTHWAPNEYAVTLDKNGGTADGSATATYDAGSLAIGPAAVRTNYHVTGYYTLAVQGVMVAEADGTLIASVDGYTDGSGNWIRTEDTELFAHWEADVYTITYVLNGGTNSQFNQATYTVETLSFNLFDASKHAYTFHGWYDNAEFDGDSITGIPRGSTGDRTLYAKLVPNSYRVNIDGNGVPNGSATAVFDATSLSDISAPSRTGYSIAGYYSEITAGIKIADANGVFIADIDGWTDADGRWKVDGNLWLYTRWTPNSYNVTLLSNGGESDGTASVVYGTSSMEILTLPVKTGYRIIGFYQNAQDQDAVALADGSLNPGEGGHTNAEGSWVLASDATLYAKWAAVDYTIPLDKGDGDTDGSGTATYDGKPLVINTAPTRSGYSVEGYYNSSGVKVAEANGTLIAGVDDYTDGTGNWIYAGSPHLSARWTIVTYSITYELDGAANNPANPSTYTVDTDTITLADPSRHGYRFIGWYTDYGFTHPVTSIPKGTTGDMTLYAKLEAIVCDVTLDRNGGNADGSARAAFDCTGLTIDSLPQLLGYHVVGFFTDADGSTMVADAEGSLQRGVAGYTDAEGRWTLTQAARLYVHWAGDVYTLVIDKSGGEADGTAEVTYGGTMITPVSGPTMTGYTVSSYFVTFEGQRVGYMNGQLLPDVDGYTDSDGKWIRTVPTTLFVSWQANKYTLTIDRSGGESDGSVEVEFYSRPGFARNDPVRTGYQPTGPLYLDEACSDEMMLIDENGRLVASVDGYTDGQGRWIRDGACTVYTEWSAKSYDIAVQANGGSPDVTFGATYNSPLLEHSGIPALAGNDIEGYYTQDQTPLKVINADFTFVSNVAEYTDEHGNWIRDGGVTLSAHWTLHTYAITLDRNGGESNGSASVRFSEGELLSFTAAQRAGYTPAGYYAGQDPTALVISAEGALIASVEGYTDEHGNWIAAYDATLSAKWQAQQYNVTLDAGEGSVDPASVKVTFGERYELHAASWDGHYFSAWKNGDVTVASVGTWNIASDVVLTAEWSEQPIWQISFDGGNGSSGYTEPISVLDGQTLTFPANGFSREGYVFAGWSDGNATYQPGATKAGISAAEEFSALWTANVHKVTYKVDGVTLEGDYAPSDHSFASSVAVLGVYQKRGYDISAWTTQDAVIIDGQFSMPDRDVVFNASSTPWNFAVPLLMGDIGNYDGTASVDFGATSLTVNTQPSRDGYHVGGYATYFSKIKVAEADGTLIASVDDDSPYTDSQGRWNRTGESVIMSLYAIWVPDDYDVGLDRTGGSTDGAARVTYDSTSLEITSVPTRTGYVVEGYYTSDDLATKVARADGRLIESVDGYTNVANQWVRVRATTLYVNWTPCYYTVTLDKNGGSADGTSRVVFDSGSLASITAPVREGYHVSGYFAAADGNVLVAGADGVLAASAEGYTDASGKWVRADDAVLYAHWEANEYTITFDTKGGTPVGPITVSFGADVVAPQPPTREGYDFGGWTPAPPAKMPAHDLTVAAKWASRPAATNNETVVFVSDSDSVIIDTSSPATSSALADGSKTVVDVSGSGWKMEIPKEVVSGATGSVSASAKPLDDAAKAALPESVKARVEGKTVYSLDLSDANGAIAFTGKKIKVSLPYELKDGESASDVKVFCINGDQLEEFDATYDAERKMAVFETEHFSDWFVDVVESPSGSGGVNVFLIVGIVVVLLAVAGAVTFFVIKKKGAGAA